MAKPGDSLTMRADVISHHEESAKVKVATTCGSRRVCQAEILYVYLQVDDPRLEASRTEYLDILTRGTTLIE